MKIFLLILLLALTSCGDNCECVDFHIEVQTIYYIDGTNTLQPMQVSQVVCDQFICDTLKEDRK